MINPAELRIGNYITSKEWKGYHTISGIEITETGFELLINGFIHKYEPGKYFDIEPILLTEEILLKCSGHNKYSNVYFIGKLNFDVNTIGKIRFHYSGKIVYLDFLHQLQNLTFCLTGKELNITLD